MQWKRSAILRKVLITASKTTNLPKTKREYDSKVFIMFDYYFKWYFNTKII